MIPALLLAFLLPYHDVGGVSTTNGQSTLVAWTNEFSPYPSSHRVYIRLLDSPFDRNAVRLGNGYDPHVATNGRDYLVAWSIRPSRFVYYPNDNAAAQLVSAEGAPGTRTILNHSLFGGVSAAVWNGTHWMVAYHYDQGVETLTRVVLLDETLNVVASADTGRGYIVELEQLGGRWWALRVEQSTVEAIEIRADGAIGARYSAFPVVAFGAMTHSAQPLLLAQSGDQGIVAFPFDPDSGFGSQRPFLANARLTDVEPFNDGDLLLITTDDYAHNELAFVDASGEIRNHSPLLTPGRWWPYASLGTSKNGPVFFISPPIEEWSLYGVELYRYPLTTITPLDPKSGELVSQIAPRRRAAAH